MKKPSALAHPRNWRPSLPQVTRSALTKQKKSSPSPSPRSKRAAPGPEAVVRIDGESFQAEVLMALLALKQGNFSARLPHTWHGVAGKMADAFNDLAEEMDQQTSELNRVSRVVGQEGRINERMRVSKAPGGWACRVESVNTLIECLVHPTRETARVIGA